MSQAPYRLAWVPSGVATETDVQDAALVLDIATANTVSKLEVGPGCICRMMPEKPRWSPPVPTWCQALATSGARAAYGHPTYLASTRGTQIALIAVRCKGTAHAECLFPCPDTKGRRRTSASGPGGSGAPHLGLGHPPAPMSCPWAGFGAQWRYGPPAAK